MTTSREELLNATKAAHAAFRVTRRSSPRDRSEWLTAVARRLESRSEELIEIAHQETHLSTARLTGELTRTIRQLLLFAELVIEGSYLEVIIDRARPWLTPPTPELRRMLVPLGPVAVFGASNFPFAFSVAGGDTASALAAGNPVIVKGHSAHPELSHQTALTVQDALAAADAPDGVFGHVTGREIGVALVEDPRIAAVGFTGSLAAGRALHTAASSRPAPIPFYGELSAMNPVVITPSAAEERADELAAGLANSFQLDAGQYCTKPGIVFVPAGSGFAGRLEALLVEPQQLLTPAMAHGFQEGVSGLAVRPDIGRLGGRTEPGDGWVESVVLTTTIDRVLSEPSRYLTECFGPATVIVEYMDPAEVVDAVRLIGGSLTATVHAQPDEDIAELVQELSMIAGRLLFEGWPTGVAVNWAQHHGGPWPSSSSIHTSVGPTAIRRFLRPLAWQSAPDELLPPELQEANPLEIPRRVDGELLPGRVRPLAHLVPTQESHEQP